VASWHCGEGRDSWLKSGTTTLVMNCTMFQTNAIYHMRYHATGYLTEVIMVLNEQL
jgi:hypothetical protein